MKCFMFTVAGADWVCFPAENEKEARKEYEESFRDMPEYFSDLEVREVSVEEYVIFNVKIKS